MVWETRKDGQGGQGGRGGRGGRGGQGTEGRGERLQGSWAWSSGSGHARPPGPAVALELSGKPLQHTNRTVISSEWPFEDSTLAIVKTWSRGGTRGCGGPGGGWLGGQRWQRDEAKRTDGTYVVNRSSQQEFALGWTWGTCAILSRTLCHTVQIRKPLVENG